MIKKISILTIFTAALSGCVQPPQSPMEAHARRAAGAEIVAKNCAAFAGGFSAVKDLKASANQNIVTARKLGATDAVIETARQDVRTAFSTAETFTSRQEACNSLIGELAWVVG